MLINQTYKQNSCTNDNIQIRRKHAKLTDYVDFRLKQV